MKRKSLLPEVPSEALRDHGTPERTERIWRRLENDLATSPARPRTALWWAPAFVLIVFGSGVVVGARWGRSEEPAQTTVEAERPDPDSERPSGQELREPTLPSPEKRVDRKHHRGQLPLPLVEPEAPTGESIAPVPPMPVLTSAAPVDPEWYRLANQNDDNGARQAIERQGGFDAVMAAASPEQLMVLADFATSTGQTARAIQALRRVVEQFPHDPNAPDAALTLGHRLAQAGDRSGAAKAYATYRALSPKGDFAEDALAREVEVAVEQGNVELARKLTDQYAKDFPNGRRLGELRAQLAKLTGERAKQPAQTQGGTSPNEEEAPGEEPEEPAPPPAGK